MHINWKWIHSSLIIQASPPYPLIKLIISTYIPLYKLIKCILKFAFHCIALKVIIELFELIIRMFNWGSIVVTVMLFVLLTPGLLFQVPGRSRCIEFGNFQTSAAAIVVHSLLYFGLVCLFLIAIRVHFYIG